MNVVIAAGGSGGHLFPALRVAQAVKARAHHVFFLGSFGTFLPKIRSKDFDCKNLTCKGFVNQSPMKKIISIGYMLKAIVQAVVFIRANDISVIVGFGGYGAFPVVVAGKLLNKKILIHEQNVQPGKANLYLNMLVNHVAVSFEETKKYFRNKNITLTGCPTFLETSRKDTDKIYESFKLDKQKKTILVFGGSQGSVKINANVIQMAAKLDPEHYQIIHATGANDFDDAVEAYKELSIEANVHSFIEDMNGAYEIADLVISRAGALTIFEIAQLSKKAVLIPYPFANQHQLKNAMVLEESRLVDIIEEKNLNPETLLNVVIEKINSTSVEDSTHNPFISNAEHKIANIVEELY